MKYIIIFLTILAVPLACADNCQEALSLEKWKSALMLCDENKNSIPEHTFGYGMALIYSGIDKDKLKKASSKYLRVSLTEEENKKLREGVYWLEKASHKNHDVAMIYYGIFYVLLNSNKMSEAEKTEFEALWNKKSADLGNIYAAFLYGRHGVSWRGPKEYVVTDKNKFSYLEFAAKHGHPDAIDILSQTKMSIK